MRIKNLQPARQRTFWPDTKRWIGSRRGLYQFLLAAAAGFAFAAALGVAYKAGAWKVIEPPIRALFVETESTANAALGTNGLPTVYFDIGFAEYQAMARQRDEALERGILLLDDGDWMRAQIRYRDETIPVRVRLKGDWVDHLGENKWSFRVKTRRDATFMGMRSFSVQSPSTRQFLNEWLFLEDLRRADLLAPRYSFLNVVVNGDDWGVYALEESFAKELLESQGRREGVIVRLSEDLFWRRRSLYGGIEDHWKMSVDSIAATFESPAFAEADEFETTEVQNDPVLREESAAALGLLRGLQDGVLTLGQVFDTELLGRYIAHTNLWGARHSLVWHNERYYYNPLTSRLEPIGYDALPLHPTYYRFTDLAQYDDLAVMRAYAQEAMRIAQPEYLEELRLAYEDEFEQYYTALAQEFDPANLQAPWDVLAERQAMLVSALHPPQSVYAYQVSGGDGPILDLQVANILQYAVVLQKLQIGDQGVAIQPDWIVTNDATLLHPEAEPQVVLRRVAANSPQYITLQIPMTVVDGLIPTGTLLYSNTLQMVTNLYGLEDQIVVDVRRDYPPALATPALPPQPSVAEVLERHPFLTASEQPGFLELKAGSWAVDGDLILPDRVGLWATQAVTLTFDPEALFFSNGPLLLRGPDEGGIYLGPKGDNWAGMFVLQADPALVSYLHNVEIRATKGISRGGWITTGGVTFYESPVVLSHSRLLDSVAEDTINVVRSEFEFTDTEFGNAASDAFDGDFVQGSVEQCAFHDIRGDGIDVSGSNITVKDVNLLRVFDKGISAGEGSTVEVNRVRAADVSIALASKDMSLVTAYDVDISHAWVAGLAAYLKKMEYGPATIQASRITFEDQSSRTLVQTGSSVTIDSTAADTTDLNVPDLYRWLEELASMQFLGYRVGANIRLVGYQIPTPELKAGDALQLELYWQADYYKPVGDYTIFVHVLDGQGNLVAQRDSMPRDNALPTSLWPPGELIDDTHVVPLPPDLPAGEYRVVVGVYVWQTGERLPVTKADGGAVPNGAIVLDQTVRVGD